MKRRDFILSTAIAGMGTFLVPGCIGGGNKAVPVYRKQDGWESLYNGRNLDGWHIECQPADRDKAFWKAEGEYIECNSLGQPYHDYFWLMSDREYDDFQLRFEFQVLENSKGNSGLQFRSRLINRTKSQEEAG